MNEMTDFTKLSKQLEGCVTEVRGSIKPLSDRILDLEQKAARRPGPAAAASASGKGLGDALVDSDEFKTLMGTASAKGRARVQVRRGEVKAINSAITSGAGSAGGLVPADQRYTDLVEIARQSLPIRALCSESETTSNLIIYPRQASRSLNAAGIAETTMKPQSDVTFSDVQVPVRTLAHIFRFSNQVLYDAPALRAFINDEAQFGLKLIEEQQFLYGDGTSSNPASQNLFGMVPQASPLTVPAGRATPGSDTAIDKIVFAMEMIVGAALPVDGLILNPIDWLEIMRIKDGNGRYLSGGPFSTDIISRIWNLNICASLSMVQGQFLVGGFKNNVRIYDRQEMEVLLSTEDRDNFVTNQVTCRAEERTCITVLRPAGLVYGSLNS